MNIVGNATDLICTCRSCLVCGPDPHGLPPGLGQDHVVATGPTLAPGHVPGPDPGLQSGHAGRGPGQGKRVTLGTKG